MILKVILCLLFIPACAKADNFFTDMMKKKSIGIATMCIDVEAKKKGVCNFGSIYSNDKFCTYKISTFPSGNPYMCRHCFECETVR